MSEPHDPVPIFDATPADADASSDPSFDPSGDSSGDPSGDLGSVISSTPGRRKARRFRGGGCLSIAIALVVVIALGYVGVTRGLDSIKDRFSGPDDYSGAGTGSVTFEVRDGESVSTVGANLEQAGVVASLQAFSDAVDASGKSIQTGVFPLKKKMSAARAVAVLVDRDQRLSSLTLLPGKTVQEIVNLLGKDTDFSKSAYQKALDNPDALGLPAAAKGNAEGYLYPGQYFIGPDSTAASILGAMVDRYQEMARKVDLAGAAERLGYTEHQLLTVASMVQAEVPAKDMPKVARVIYNRLEIDPNPTAGFLQIDATVNYALGRGPIARLTIADIDSVADSPYNTYRQKGLPPGPIEAPGEAALEAAANPADGPWFFYVTVNLRTQKTKFTADYDEFLRFSDELDVYCATQSIACG